MYGVGNITSYIWKNVYAVDGRFTNVFVSGLASNTDKLVKITTNGQLAASGVDFNKVVTTDGPQTIQGLKKFQNNIEPLSDNDYNLGASEKRWAYIYGNNCVVDNISIVGQDSNKNELICFDNNGQLVTSNIQYNNVVTKTDPQTISGQKTFDAAPLPGGTIDSSSKVSTIALGSALARWNNVYTQHINLTGHIYSSADPLYINVGGSDILIEGYSSARSNRVKLMKETFVKGNLLPENTTDKGAVKSVRRFLANAGVCKDEI